MVVLSDFLDGEEEWKRRLQFAASARYECICMQILDDDELVLPDSDALRFVALEGNGEVSASPELIRKDYQLKMKQYLEGLQSVILHSGAEYQLLQTDQEFGHALPPFPWIAAHSADDRVRSTTCWAD